jgi:hypothetical protein
VISTCIVRVAGSIDAAVRATSPAKVWPRSSACVTTTFWPRPHELRVGLRHVDVDAQRIHLREHEQHLAARVDEVADLDAAPRDHPVEWRDHARESLQLSESLDVGVGSREVRLGLCHGAAPLVELLLRDDVLLA